MINIQRNFFVENILLDANLLDKNTIKNIPYKDYINTSVKEDLAIIFLDIDRIENKKDIIKDITKYKNKNNKVIFIPFSKNEEDINNLIDNIEKKKLSNILNININKLGVKKKIDKKREKIFKSYLSLEITLTLSKILSKIISILNNRDIRLASVDLDNTCWTGVIGEDGIKKIFLDNHQQSSLYYISELIKKTGLLFSIHSKNNEKLAIKGIKNKFSQYKNLITKSFKYINWDPKVISIKKIAEIVNFSKKNIIYFDDNISEIKQINKFLLKKNCLWIKNSYFFYLYTKSLYISNISKEKNLNRFKDIKSNIKRNEATNNKGILDYIKTSSVKVLFSTRKIDLNRFTEMSNKTNQFNSNYMRYNLKSLKIIKKNNNIKLITFTVSDKYSDSGIICSLVLEKRNNVHIINEFLISCRALGRDLEYIFLSQIIKKYSIKNLIVPYKLTDRNVPFIKFIEKIKLKKDTKNYWLNLNKINKHSIEYEKYIKIKNN